jgi:hypothetical protein
VELGCTTEVGATGKVEIGGTTDEGDVGTTDDEGDTGTTDGTLRHCGYGYQAVAAGY